MSQQFRRWRHLGFTLAALAAPGVSLGQDSDSIEEIVVTGQNVFRDRTDDINPTLRYDLEFFQRFEPLTAGEMLKRIPGVVFSRDILEYDGVQLRGLESGYTEILINGRPVSGKEADGSFFVDRIPAELVESIEVIRAPSADMSGEGAAGSLNINLKEGAQIEGILARLSTMLVPEGEDSFFDGDTETKFNGALAIAGATSNSDYWLGLNVQQRFNPKEKLELFYDAPTGDLEGYQFEDDTRNGTDYSLNGSFNTRMGQGDLSANLYYVVTEREENQYEAEYEGSVPERVAVQLTEWQETFVDISQTSWSLDGIYTHPVGQGTLELSAAMARFEDETDEFEYTEEWDTGVLDDTETDTGSTSITDDSYQLELAYALNLGSWDVKTGLNYSMATREGDHEGVIFDGEADVEESRLSPYVTAAQSTDFGLSYEAGVRYTRYERDMTSDDGDASQSGGELLPSFSLLWDADENRRFRLSLARTLRRPDFDLIIPFEEDETPQDEDFTIGNPDLDSETIWGLDVGVEQRLPQGGIVGLNFFYRNIRDLVEITNTGILASTIDPDPQFTGFVFQPRNVGDATTSGIEFDISMPLSLLGLDNTGFYANYAYMNSSVTDAYTGRSREMRNQPNYVYNLSLTQDIPAWNTGLGLSYQKRGSSLATEFSEYVVLEYDANLEVFAEVNLNDNMVVRLSGTNLLDAEKREIFREFGEPVNEIELEESSAVYTLTLRATF